MSHKPKHTKPKKPGKGKPKKPKKKDDPPVARTVHVYPKAIIEGSEWRYIAKVGDSRLEHGTGEPGDPLIVSSVTAVTPLVLLKLVFDVVVADTDTDQDIDDALFVDDIRSGPQTETVWGNWQGLAESIISGLAPGYTADDFWAAWSIQDTNAVRQDARRALVTQRGWTIVSVHQHEGDGTVLDE